MTIEVEDVLRINVVLAGISLLGEQSQRDKFAGLVGVEVGVQELPENLAPPWAIPDAPLGSSMPEIRLNLPKERITLQAKTSATTIERQYPSVGDLERLAEVTSIAIDSTGATTSTLLAFGFNIDWICRQDQEQASAKYIAERLFSEKWRTIVGWSLVGERSFLTFADGDTTRTFRVEPRANDLPGRRIYLNLNLHRDRQEIPERGEIWQSLQEIWDNAQMLTQLLGS